LLHLLIIVNPALVLTPIVRQRSKLFSFHCFTAGRC